MKYNYKHIHHRRHTTSALAAAIIAVSSLGSVATQAQESLALEEVIVTSQKRVQSLQDVPISVNVLSAEKLENTGINDLENLSSYVPNFSINQTGISTTISIRGISSGINQGFEQSVGMYVDGIYLGRAQLARAPLFDMERVEVLRGPQSILFGKNSIAGAVSMSTAKPTEEFEGSVSVLYEPDHGEQEVRFVVSGPLTDTLGGRLSIYDRTFDGYIKNTVTGEDEPNKDEQVVRATLAWEPTDNFSASVKVETGSFDVKGRNIEIIADTAAETGAGLSTVYPIFSGGQALDATQNFSRQSNGDTSDNETENFVLTMDYGLGEHTLTSVTGFTAYEYDELCDCEYSGINTFTLGLKEEFDQLSQEVRIVSPQGETIDYIAGLFYQTSDLKFNDDFFVPTGSALTNLSATFADSHTRRQFDQDSDLWSVFAQATLNMSDAVRLTLGGRYTDETKDGYREVITDSPAPGAVFPGGTTEYDIAQNVLRAEEHTISGSRSETSFTPLANLQVDLNDNVMVYATYTTGFKSGGFDARSNASPDPTVGVPAAITTIAGVAPSPVGVFEFEEEEATSFEIGTKMSLLDGQAELNIAAYKTDYDDLQVSIFDGGLGFNVGNAAKATVQGLEFDGRLRATEQLTLSGSLGYLDFEFKDFDDGECYFRQTDSITNAALGTCSLDGKRQVYTPEITANLAADFIAAISDDLEFRATLDLNYSDDYLTSQALDPRTEQDAFTKVGLRLSISDTEGDWEVAIVGKNLTDESVNVFSAEVPTSGLLVDTVTGQSDSGLAYYGFFDRPRSVALQAKVRF